MIFRFSNSLLGIILITAVGSGMGFVLGNPPERTTFDSETQTCVFSDISDNNIIIIVVASYVMLVFFQGKCLIVFRNLLYKAILCCNVVG